MYPLLPWTNAKRAFQTYSMLCVCWFTAPEYTFSAGKRAMARTEQRKVAPLLSQIQDSCS